MMKWFGRLLKRGNEVKVLYRLDFDLVRKVWKFVRTKS
jgi:hypothetical protein